MMHNETLAELGLVRMAVDIAKNEKKQLQLDMTKLEDLLKKSGSDVSELRDNAIKLICHKW